MNRMVELLELAREKKILKKDIVRRFRSKHKIKPKISIEWDKDQGFSIISDFIIRGFNWVSVYYSGKELPTLADCEDWIKKTGVDLLGKLHEKRVSNNI